MICVSQKYCIWAYTAVDACLTRMNVKMECVTAEAEIIAMQKDCPKICADDALEAFKGYQFN